MLTFGATWVTRPRIRIALSDRPVLAMNDVLDTSLDGHFTALCLRFGFGWCGVGGTLVAFGLVDPTIVVLAGLDVTLGHLELLNLRYLFPQAGIERMFPHLHSVVASTRRG